MKLTQSDLENISQGRFSQLKQWPSVDMDPNRVIIPANPILLIDEVQKIEDFGQGKGKITYTCNLKDNPLVQGKKYIPLSLLIEMGQCNMILADFLGYGKCPKGIDKVHYRALGGEITVHEYYVPIDTKLEIELEITKNIKIQSAPIFIFDVFMRADNRAILTVKNFRAIFVPTQAIHKKGTSYTRPSTILTQKFDGAFSSINNYDSFHTLSIGNGLVASVRNMREDEWFYKVHFIHDPCIPGNFVGQSVYDTLTFYYEKIKNKELIIKSMTAYAKANVLPHHKQLEVYSFIKEETDDSVLIDADIIADGVLSFQIKDIKGQLCSFKNHS